MSKRYSLRAVLCVLTLAAIVLGYSQWRRQQLLQRVEVLTNAGVTVYARQGWWTRAWMPIPRAARLSLKEGPKGQFAFGGAGYSLAEADERIVQFRGVLR